LPNLYHSDIKTAFGHACYIEGNTFALGMLATLKEIHLLTESTPIHWNSCSPGSTAGRGAAVAAPMQFKAKCDGGCAEALRH
jgi:hypothetical protein